MTDHFHVYTEEPPKVYQDAIERLEDVHAGLTSSFFNVAIPKVEVYIFNATEFEEIMGPIGGFFMSSPGQPPIFAMPRGWDLEFIDSMAAYQMGVSFIHANYPSMPIWVLKGFGNYIESMKIREGRVWFGNAHTWKGQAAATHGMIPVVQLFSMTQAEFEEGDTIRHDATAWAVFHYIWHGENNALRPRFEAFMNALIGDPQDLNRSLRAWDKVYPDFPVKTLDDRVARHLTEVFALPVSSVVGFDLVRPTHIPIQVQPADLARLETVKARLRQARKRQKP